MEDQCKKDIDPILDVFGGGDGGVGFAILTKRFLPEIYKKENKSQIEKDLIVMVKQFSRLCQAALNGQL